MFDVVKSETEQDITKAFLEHRGGLMRYLSRFLRSPADVEDVSQEVFIRAFRAAQKKTVDQPKPFLFRIARNAALTELKRQSASIIKLVDNLSPELDTQYEPSAEDGLAKKERLKIFWQAVNALPPQCRRVFVMRKVYGFRHKEIASALGISTSTVEKHLANGLQKCIEHARMQEDGEDVVYLRAAGDNRIGDE